ncbi:MAG: hypothetical protein ACYS7Y_29595 [Planctomycetota bacterium]
MDYPGVAGYKCSYCGGRCCDGACRGCPECGGECDGECREEEIECYFCRKLIKRGDGVPIEDMSPMLSCYDCADDDR